jgi:hypothetical protein
MGSRKIREGQITRSRRVRRRWALLWLALANALISFALR